MRPTDRPLTVRTLLHVSQCEMRHSKPVLQPGFFSAGGGMANFFQKNKREFWRKLIVVLVEYFHKRHMSRKQATNNEIWNPRATEKANKQAKCQLKTKMWWVSNSQVTLQTIIGNFPYLTYFKLDTNTWVVAIYDKYSWINYFWTFTELFTIMNCFEHFVLDLVCIINSFAAHICKHAVNA